MKKLIGAFAFCLTLAASATTYYVSPDGDGTDPTVGFETGYAKIEDAIAAATTDGDVVLLDRTTFKATASKDIYIKNAITVTGVGEKEETIIDGQKNSYCLYLKNKGAKVQNLTLAHNGSQWTGCLGMQMDSGMISNVVARQNGNAWDKSGNARYTFKLYGGLLTHCIITNNYAPTCPGVYLGSNATMENCYLADNRNRGLQSNAYGSAVEAWGGTIRNCTIVNNKGDSYAIYCKSGVTKIYNCIIWGNTYQTTSSVGNWIANGTSTANWIGNQTMPIEGLTGESNSEDDPLLTPDNFNIMKSSPCNGTAVKDYAAAIDFNNTVRGDKPSRGCVEYVDLGTLSCVISASATAVNYPETVTVEAQIDGTVTEPLAYAWDLKNDGTFLSTEAKPILSAIGCYHPSVTITDANGKTVSATFANDIIIYGNEGVSYVTNGVNPKAEAPYATWETAATNIADAAKIAQLGSKVMLCEGTHTINGVVEVNQRMTLTTVAGYERTSIRITNGNSDSLFKLNAIGAILEGFSITNQSLNNCNVGAAIRIMNGGVRNCRFARNATNGHGMVTTDGDSVDAFVENCVFVGNYPTASHSQGPAGVKLMGNRPRCVNCLFWGNTNLAYVIGYPGGALYAQSGSSIVRNCTFVDNLSRLGPAGVVAVGTSFGGTVENCIFTGNMTTTNLAVTTVFKSDDPLLETHQPSSGTPTNIVSRLLSPTSLRNCCIVASTNDYTGYTMILKDDPKFVDAENGDYAIPRESPCVNKGENGSWTADDKDLGGNPRVFLRHVDIGAYENQTANGHIFLLK